MTADLTYHLRRGMVTGFAGTQRVNHRVHQDQSRILTWEKAQELRPGKVTLWDHVFEIPPSHSDRGRSISGGVPAGEVGRKLKITDNGILEVCDYPVVGAAMRPTQSFAYSQAHMHIGSTAFVGVGGGGFFIHGWPPCNYKRCIIITSEWERLVGALSEEKYITFFVEY